MRPRPTAAQWAALVVWYAMGVLGVVGAILNALK